MEILRRMGGRDSDGRINVKVYRLKKWVELGMPDGNLTADVDEGVRI